MHTELHEKPNSESQSRNVLTAVTRAQLTAFAERTAVSRFVLVIDGTRISLEADLNRNAGSTARRCYVELTRRPGERRAWLDSNRLVARLHAMSPNTRVEIINKTKTRTTPSHGSGTPVRFPTHSVE